MQYELRGIGPFATNDATSNISVTEPLVDAAGGKVVVRPMLHNAVDATVKAYILRRTRKTLLRLACTLRP